ncbi:right-handed parallel beta-helix repeat-containing protein [candidate division KSB1 bacterium]|nr:right-handed parallel beta-helix repeat-containing protein [candidate division KSB1 bacterium]
MIRYLFSFAFIFFIIWTSVGSANTYYVSPGGNDSYTKTQAQSPATPWRTIQKAANSVYGGDTIVLDDGVYQEGVITFANSGTAQQWITLTNFPGTQPTISKTGDLQGILLDTRFFIHINGLALHGYDRDGISVFSCGNIICTNIHAYDNGNAGINVVNSDYILIQDSELHHNGWKADDNSGWGDGASINNDNAVGKISVFRRNVCYANWQKRAGSYWDGNGYTLDMAGAGGLHIVANNVFYNNGGTGLLAGETENIKLVHNVFYRNKADAECRNKAEVYLVKNEAHNTVIKNNIIYARPGIWTLVRDEGEDNAVIGANLIWGEDDEDTQIYWLEMAQTDLVDWIQSRANATRTGAPHFAAAPIDNRLTTFHNSSWIEMDASHYDFKLLLTSECINAGTSLTATRSAGSGAVVEVEDAGFFTDGFGKIDGDYVKIGSNNPIKITGVDYTTNSLTIAPRENMNWNAGDPVHFPFDGAAPDIGAYEFFTQQPLTAIVSTSKPSPAPDGSIQVSIMTSIAVTRIPSPLLFIESDATITSISLVGAVPGSSFSGEFLINEQVAEGIGHFALQEDALVDDAGNTGNQIIAGNTLRIDRTPPDIPMNLRLGGN